MEGDTENTARDNLAAMIAGALLLPAVYVAFFVLNWDSIAAKAAFVIVVPSVIGSVIAAAVR